MTPHGHPKIKYKTKQESTHPAHTQTRLTGVSKALVGQIEEEKSRKKAISKTTGGFDVRKIINTGVSLLRIAIENEKNKYLVEVSVSTNDGCKSSFLQINPLALQQDETRPLGGAPSCTRAETPWDVFPTKAEPLGVFLLAKEYNRRWDTKQMLTSYKY